MLSEDGNTCLLKMNVLIIVFDPPHLIQPKNKKLLGMVACYGVLYIDEWKEQLTAGISDLFRSLKSNGTFILKWCENNKKVDDIIKLFPYKPMFGTRTGQRNNNHWICFIKSRQDMTFMDFENADEV